MKKIEFCLASNNAHKIKELQAMLGEDFIIKTMHNIGCHDDIEEYGTTLEQNSKIKADYIHDKYQINVIADDSGLEIEALENRPGVYSARYAGEPTNHKANIAKVLTEMQGKTNRNAKFRTVITMILDNKTSFFEGDVSGKITSKCQGEEGFGYDPIFMPDGFGITFAEMSSIQKNQLSHRANAIKKLIESLKTKK
jgi:XTP/dITP diphosphohydrolase